MPSMCNNVWIINITSIIVDIIVSISIESMHYGNIFEYLSLWSEVQFLNIQKSKKIQEIQKPN